MSEIQRIVDQLQRAFDGDAWSGPSLGATLQGLSAAQAATRVLPTAHSIWEIVLHLTAWIQTVQQRIQEDQLIEVSDADDWSPVPPVADTAAWQRALAALKQAHIELLATVAQLPVADLDRQLGTSRDQPQGGVSHYVMLHGLAQHNLYHAGQIALLRKAVGA